MALFKRRTRQPPTSHTHQDLPYPEVAASSLVGTYAPSVDKDIFDNDAIIHAVPIVEPDSLGVANAFSGFDVHSRVEGIHQMLDTALDQWWTHGILPSTLLLRDALLALEAGHDFDESHRSLLLRIALDRDKGMITAIRHQRDAERTAFLLKEAILNLQSPLSTQTLWQLQNEDDQSYLWVPLLAAELRYESAILNEPRRTLALASLAQLQSEYPLTLPENGSSAQKFLANSHVIHRIRGPLRRLVILAAVLLVTVGGIAWQTRRPSLSTEATVPDGRYLITDPQQPNRQRMVETPGFVIDRYEVTNQAYRQCIAENGCTAPEPSTRENNAAYSTDPHFDGYPVSNVSWLQAEAYCRWVGKRLPSEEEWQVAASVAPATSRIFTYPWGNHFEPRLVNSVVTGARAPQPVGLYHPVGDSPFGISDLAGNVAEWTATAGDTSNHYIAKGGSYLDNSEAIRASTRVSLAQNTSRDWLGFRCVAPLENNNSSGEK